MTRPLLIVALLAIAGCDLEMHPKSEPSRPVSWEGSSETYRIPTAKKRQVSDMRIGETARVTVYYHDDGRPFVWPDLEINQWSQDDVITRHTEGYAVRIVRGHKAFYPPTMDAIFPRVEQQCVEQELTK